MNRRVLKQRKTNFLCRRKSMGYTLREKVRTMRISSSNTLALSMIVAEITCLGVS